MSIESLIHSPNFLATLCGGAAFVVVVLIWTALVDSDPLPARMKTVTQRRSELVAEERKKKVTRREGTNRADMMKQVVQKLKLAQGQKMDELRVKLSRAGYRSRDTIYAFIFIKLAAPPLLAFLTFFYIFVLKIYPMKPMMGVAAVVGLGIFGIALPELLLKNKSQKREVILRKGMPDALDLMVICAEAGLSLDATFERVSREMGPSCPELAEEIGLTSVELSFLPDRAKALQNLSARVPQQGVMALVNTLIQTERYGTPLAQALRVLSGEMREERIMGAEAKAAKLPATLTVPMILFILPPLFVVLLGPAILKVMKL